MTDPRRRQMSRRRVISALCGAGLAASAGCIGDLSSQGRATLVSDDEWLTINSLRHSMFSTQASVTIDAELSDVDFLVSVHAGEQVDVASIGTGETDSWLDVRIGRNQIFAVDGGEYEYEHRGGTIVAEATIEVLR